MRAVAAIDLKPLSHTGPGREKVDGDGVWLVLPWISRTRAAWMVTTRRGVRSVSCSQVK